MRLTLRLPPPSSWRLPKLDPSTAFYAVVAILASAPAWIVQYPPMMDLPFHLATIRVVHSIHDPAFHLDADFVVTIGRTQYVLYYLVGSALAYVVGVFAANVALMSAYFAGTVLGLRSLLKALGKDERLCLLVIPLLVNVMFFYGLFPFLLGIPIMFFALATAVRHFEKPTIGRAIGLSALALALFYSHVFPFGIFALGFAAMFPWTRPREWIRAALPVVPAAAVLAWWTFFTEAGQLTRGALTDNAHDEKHPLDDSIRQFPNFLTNVFNDTSDEAIFVALLVVVVATIGLSAGEKERIKGPARAYALLPIACVILYFTSPWAHGYIWLIAQRFPILFCMTAIPLLRMPTGWRGWLVATGAVGVAAASIVNTSKHFIEFQKKDVGDFNDAIEVMAPGKKVCALIYDKGSTVVNGMFAPFLHFGSYYQAAKGGVIEFTYAGYKHWPFDFQSGHYPPQLENGQLVSKPARERWEWTPERVQIQEIYPYYDYVLTRGFGFQPPPGTYRMKWKSERWAVWEKQ